jgi:V-type H+-transporting ATPase proteolipid subunit
MVMGHVFRDAMAGADAAHNTDVYGVVTVVDKLPVPLDSEHALSGTLHGSSEGISLLFADKGTLFASSSRKSLTKDVSTLELHPTILYDVSYTSESGPALSTQVATPVASTVFTTGQPHTLISARWRFSGQETRSPFAIKMLDLAQLRIGDSSHVSSLEPFVPLRALTKARRVVTGMGNIISRLAADDPNETVPASAGLEMRIPEYVKEHNLHHQRLAVWALVTDPSSCPDPNRTLDDAGYVRDSLLRGGRLYRIMGGGGGWGKKQGLLSLDPDYGAQQDISLSPERPIDQLLEDGHKDVEESSLDMLDELPSFLQHSQASAELANVANPGDLVQFFIAPLDQAEAPSQKATGSLPVGDETVRIFGVIPSGDTSQAVAAPATDQAIFVVHNQFGALSEKSVNFVTSKPQQLETAAGNPRPSGTKIDVPGSRIVLRW